MSHSDWDAPIDYELSEEHAPIPYDLTHKGEKAAVSENAPTVMPLGDHAEGTRRSHFNKGANEPTNLSGE